MKKAFTIAEVLISLAIIGVVSALTLPTLNANIQKNQAGPALMKAINDIDQANRWLLNETDSKNIIAACDLPDDASAGISYLLCLAPPLKLDSIHSSKKFQYTNPQMMTIGSEDFDMNPDRKFVYALGGVDIWTSENEGLVNGYDGKKRIPLYIDTNGIEKGPNIFGKDLFKIFLNLKTTTLSGLEDENLQNDGINGINKMISLCENEGYECAQIILNNKGKVTYKW